MHEGCSGEFNSGKEVVNKVRMMGFATQPMPMPMNIECKACNKPFEMITFEHACPECGAIHGVTPCHAFDPENVQCAGTDI